MKSLGKLFGQILQLSEKAGLVKLGHVALDGTKIKANASKHKAMSYERMEKRAAELEAEVAKWLSAAEAADAAEDKMHGGEKTGEEMPDWIADKKRRAERIREAKAELEGPGRRRPPSGDDFHEGGLAASGWPDHRDKFSGPNVERGVMERKGAVAVFAVDRSF